MGGYYILDEDRQAVKVADVLTWGQWFETANRHVAETNIGDARISTVFLGIDHQYGDGPPLLFETIIFGGGHNNYQDRCSTYRHAEAMHERACALVRGNKQ